jgi:hypothetical protein
VCARRIHGCFRVLAFFGIALALAKPALAAKPTPGRYNGHRKQAKKLSAPKGYLSLERKDFFTGAYTGLGQHESGEFGYVARRDRLGLEDYWVDVHRIGLTRDFYPEGPKEFQSTPPSHDVPKLIKTRMPDGSTELVENLAWYEAAHDTMEKRFAWSAKRDAHFADARAYLKAIREGALRAADAAHREHGGITPENSLENREEAERAELSTTTVLVREKSNPRKIVSSIQINENIQVGERPPLKREEREQRVRAATLESGRIHVVPAQESERAIYLSSVPYTTVHTALDPKGLREQVQLALARKPNAATRLTQIEQTFAVELPRKKGVSAILEVMHWGVLRAHRRTGLLQSWLAVVRQGREIERALGLENGVQIRFVCDAHHLPIYENKYGLKRIQENPIHHPVDGKEWYVIGATVADAAALVRKAAQIDPRTGEPDKRALEALDALQEALEGPADLKQS